MLFALVIIFSMTSLVAKTDSNTGSKPDLQKVYSEALTWSKTKLEAMPKPDAQGVEQISHVCHGQQKVGQKEGQKNGQTTNAEPLPITSGCNKKKPKDMDGILDEVTTKEQDVHEPQDKILVFVSFSMPKPSLVALSKEADKHGAVLVMRGLKDDSFKKTQIALQELGKDLQSGIEINPEAFETYKIKQVPVFVRVKSTQASEIKEVGRISGNVSLSFAAHKLKETA